MYFHVICLKNWYLHVLHIIFCIILEQKLILARLSLQNMFQDLLQSFSCLRRDFNVAQFLIELRKMDDYRFAQSSQVRRIFLQSRHKTFIIFNPFQQLITVTTIGLIQQDRKIILLQSILNGFFHIYILTCEK